MPRCHRDTAAATRERRKAGGKRDHVDGRGEGRFGADLVGRVAINLAEPLEVALAAVLADL